MPGSLGIPQSPGKGQKKEVDRMIWLVISACAVVLGACVPVLSYSRYLE